jgi:serine/threonine-protein phosphatase 6 regulatory ankyrin repeat subunit C
VFNACREGQHDELLKALRQSGLDINWTHPVNGRTAAYAAAQNGHDKCLTAVIQHGGAESKMDKDGAAPIHVACNNGRIACLILLLDNGVDPNVATTNKLGLTPVVLCCLSGHVKCLALLLERGVDPDLADRGGLTPAHEACNEGQLKCLQLLIARGANFNAKDAAGRTPLDWAREKGRSECVKLLLENKAFESDVAFFAQTEDEKVR